MIRAKCSTEILSTRVGRVAYGRPAARHNAAKDFAAEFIGVIVRLVPKDTNRLVRGWVQAGKDVGVHSVPMPPLQESKHKERLVEVLSRQVQIAENRLRSLQKTMDRWYGEGSKRPKKGYYHKLAAKIRQQERRVEKAREQVQRFLGTEAALVMMRGSGGAISGFERQLDARKLMATVRDKVYGGKGRLIDTPDYTIVSLHNLEAHARVVEKYNGAVRAAYAHLRGYGIKKVGRRWVQDLLRKSA